MRLLFLTPQLPNPAQQGTALRNWGLIRHLAEQHEVGFVSLLAPGQAAGDAYPDGIKLLGTAPQPTWPAAKRAAALLAGKPDLAGRLWSREFEAALERALTAWAPRIVQIEGLELAAYLPAIRRAAPNARVVYDAHNTEYVIQRRAWQTDRGQVWRWPAAVYSILQESRLRRLEAAVGAQVDAVCCVSVEDARALRRLGLKARRVVVVPNGIDTSAYDPATLAAPEGLGPRDLVFTGKMDYRPNQDAVVWFADRVLPLIRAQDPKARFVVVGQQPGPTVRRLASREAVVITGGVADARPYIAHAAAYVAPLRMGGGTRFKLLEAMALSVPIVSTRLGAEGFAITDDREVLLADEPEELAAACLRVLKQHDLASRLGQTGRKFVAANHDWGVIVPRLEALYADLTGDN